MKINAINKLMIGGLLSGASIALSGCGGDTFGKISKYMRDNNYTQKEYEELMYQNLKYPKNQQIMTMQSTLDSMVYRDLFNTTRLADDSSAVADFNALAGRTNISKVYPDDTKVSNSERIAKILKDENVTMSEYDSVISPETFESTQQHFADKLLYSKFFKKHGLTTKDFQAKFDSVSKLAKPY